MDHTALINKLPEELQWKLKAIRSAAGKIWEKPFMDHFTKHGLEHSENIITILGLLLNAGDEKPTVLDAHELFILLAAAYLHDIGMQSAFHAGLPYKEKSEYTAEEKNLVRERHHETRRR